MSPVGSGEPHPELKQAMRIYEEKLKVSLGMKLFWGLVALTFFLLGGFLLSFKSVHRVSFVLDIGWFRCNCSFSFHA